MRSIHWDIHPGMQPIKWHISPIAAELSARPELAGYDLVGAIERGIESWNDAFGFEVFAASLTDSATGYGEDDKNW